ncbi:hypothetical protein [Streptococcus cuniculi]|uniref:Uncharacterized protein n=1 Tax=Streptococcus cuniculi TaxID=1432788 RepID=A0A4Y9JDB9_9STRE|nr:hypothetical protein [Streptococcus cuniculi]MBF0778333.1 hypothetical protein [Streptococcus cuniculi]TFU97825.1 hypothetical protein E4T82_06275 [Streptococcus cuniculi]
MTQQSPVQEILIELNVIKNALGYVLDYLEVSIDTPERVQSYLLSRDETHTLAFLAFNNLHHLVETEWNKGKE